MPEAADIFRLYTARYIEGFGQHMLPSHRRSLIDLRDCRTAALGGKLCLCDRCRRELNAYHSCPKCHGRDTEAWLARRRQELSPVLYFHVVFTVPSQLRDLLRRHHKTLYPLLMKAAAEALIQPAADPHYVRGRIGVMAMLGTWSRTLVYHPHVHCLVPAGGVAPDGQWFPARSNYLVPVKALSKLFRGPFLDLAAKPPPQATLPSSARNRPWVLHCKPSICGVDNVLKYLARSVHPVAITDHRLLSIDSSGTLLYLRRIPPQGRAPP